MNGPRKPAWLIAALVLSVTTVPLLAQPGHRGHGWRWRHGHTQGNAAQREHAQDSAEQHRASQQRHGQHGYRRGPGYGRDAAHQADMELFHFLLDHRDQITRQVTNLPGGVETLTESRNPQVAKKIQIHVASMYRRVDEQRPIHARDPLFAEIFRHADKIQMQVEKTAQGVKVIETSDDPYVARLIQTHAQVVNQFLKNGRQEMRKNHPLPEKD